MKILFVRPKMQESIEKEEPLNILYLISNLKQQINEIEIDFIDAHESRLNEEDVYEQIVEKKYDILLISTLTIGVPFAFKLTSLVKNSILGRCVKIIFGGPHPSALPKECLENGGDYCIIGEGEISICNLIKAIINKETLNDIKGIAYFKEDRTIKINQEQELIQNLDELKFPDLSSFINGKYETTIHLHTGNKALPMIASRGCNNNCPFCCSKLMWKQKIRYRSVTNFIEEIQYHYEYNNIKEFHLYDDDFLLNRRYINDFTNKIIQKNLKIKYCCLSTCKSFLNLSDNEIGLLKHSGLNLIEFGIESLIPEVLYNLNKTYKIEDLPTLINRLNENEINAYPLLMYMIPFETLNGHLFQSEKFLETFGQIPYVNQEWGSIDPDMFIFNSGAYTPFPGTKFSEEAKKTGKLITNNWENFNTEKIVFIPNSILEEIPVKYTVSINSNINNRIKRNCEYRIIEDISAIIDDLISVLWELINSRNNLFSISKIIKSKFNEQLSLETALSFVVSATLVLLLNKNVGAID